MPSTIELIIPNEVEFLLRDSTLRLNADDRDGLIQFNGKYESDHVVFWRRDDPMLAVIAAAPTAAEAEQIVEGLRELLSSRMPLVTL